MADQNSVRVLEDIRDLLRQQGERQRQLIEMHQQSMRMQEQAMATQQRAVENQLQAVDLHRRMTRRLVPAILGVSGLIVLLLPLLFIRR